MFSNKFTKLFLSNLYSLAATSNISIIPSKNFGSYNFVKNLEEGLKSAKLESKPIFLIVHKTGCGACRVLLPSLAASDDMKKLGDKFVMVNAYDGLDPKAKQYAPDGAYVPRIIFIGSDGLALTQVTNSSVKGDEYKYYYQKSEDVVRSMRLALQLNKK